MLQVGREGILFLGGFPQLLELVWLLRALMPRWGGVEWVVMRVPGVLLDGVQVQTVWMTENDRVP